MASPATPDRPTRSGRTRKGHTPVSLASVMNRRTRSVSAKLSRTPAKHWKVHYEPAPAAIRIAKTIDDEFTAPLKPILLIEANPESDVVVTYPLNTTATSTGFLGPKYGRLRTITLEEFRLSDLTEFSLSDLDDDETSQEDGVRAQAPIERVWTNSE